MVVTVKQAPFSYWEYLYKANIFFKDTNKPYYFTFTNYDYQEINGKTS